MCKPGVVRICIEAKRLSLRLDDNGEVGDAGDMVAEFGGHTWYQSGDDVVQHAFNATAVPDILQLLKDNHVRVKKLEMGLPDELEVVSEDLPEGVQFVIHDHKTLEAPSFAHLQEACRRLSYDPFN